MKSAELIADAFGRIRDIVHEAVDRVSTEELALCLDGTANSMAWLVWHLTRVQDDHVAHVAGFEQAWISSGWAERFALPFDAQDTGYEHGPAQVSAVKADGETLTGYHDAVYENTRRFVEELTDSDLDRIVDERWDPPVTLGVRLMSVISDDMQHAGQASFVRGILLDRK